MSKPLNLFVVYEGKAYSIEDAPPGLSQDNWMCDWIFVGATDPITAVRVAAVVDDFASRHVGRIYQKASNIKMIRDQILNESLMPPKVIYETQGNKVNSVRLQFNQGWVKI
jgi:hypothetical protein